MFVFTANSTEGLEPRFLSRCRVLEFSSYGMSTEIVETCRYIWSQEAPESSTPPDFTKLVKNANNNVRNCLMNLELELMEV